MDDLSTEMKRSPTWLLTKNNNKSKTKSLSDQKSKQTLFQKISQKRGGFNKELEIKINSWKLMLGAN